MRIPILCALALALAHAAGAATLSIVSDKANYAPGDIITLSIFGDAQGATTYGVFGRLEMSGAVVDLVSTSQKQLGAGWVKGALESSDDGVLLTVEAIDQIAPFPTAATQTATNPISTITLLVTSLGILNVSWNEVQGTGFELNYFGLSSAPGISINIIPEPAAMTLLGLGLVAFGAARRRRA